MLRQELARLVLRLAGWRVVGEAPHAGILVGGPHTSNWDFVLMTLVMWQLGISPKVLAKKEVFRGPLGWLMRRLGCIPVDRQHPVGVVRHLMQMLRTGEPFLLVITPEGTRKKVPYWKSGFYRLSRATGVPMVLGFIDAPRRTCGFGPTLHASGDVVADMDVIRAFFADKRGFRAELGSEPLLREEASPRRGEQAG